ncbi:hypothetical protein H257_18466 [Aphanomyces astaci]|uniref:Uncharacterized protein n=1 Tax=Aphanomyces astaci TaxID=112090 RepID=W4FDA2_APHAT|nr:hypothetical protein H257_18466 [Aphanomyces astaci]ETV64688.1 hypothetical protein H257_18466 [Aphanomyces astaci]|eukprot:XP_009845823.1 hypothetical protein H257_18466 [Aphanomyces astaci]
MPRSTTKHDLPDNERLSMCHELLENKQNGRLASGEAKEILLKTSRRGIEEEGSSGASVIATFALLTSSSGMRACSSRRSCFRPLHCSQVATSSDAVAPNARRIDIDEKWFYFTLINHRCYLSSTTLPWLLPGGRMVVPTCGTTSNEPDFNVLDLGFLNSIQAIQHRQVVTGIDDLVAAVHGGFNELDWRILDKTLVRVMEESMKMAGDNSYKLSHQSKDKMASWTHRPFSVRS